MTSRNLGFRCSHLVRNAQDCRIPGGSDIDLVHDRDIPHLPGIATALYVATVFDAQLISTERVYKPAQKGLESARVLEGQESPGG